MECESKIIDISTGIKTETFRNTITRHRPVFAIQDVKKHPEDVFYSYFEKSNHFVQDCPEFTHLTKINVGI